jgi:hypothetical protein
MNIVNYIYFFFTELWSNNKNYMQIFFCRRRYETQSPDNNNTEMNVKQKSNQIKPSSPSNPPAASKAPVCAKVCTKAPVSSKAPAACKAPTAPSSPKAPATTTYYPLRPLLPASATARIVLTPGEQMLQNRLRRLAIHLPEVLVHRPYMCVIFQYLFDIDYQMSLVTSTIIGSFVDECDRISTLYPQTHRSHAFLQYPGFPCTYIFNRSTHPLESIFFYLYDHFLVPMTPSVVLLSWIYLLRLRKWAGSQTIHRLLLTCILISLKFWEDNFELNNNGWAYMFCDYFMSTKDVNQCEWLVLQLLDYNLYTNDKEVEIALRMMLYHYNYVQTHPIPAGIDRGDMFYYYCGWKDVVQFDVLQSYFVEGRTFRQGRLMLVKDASNQRKRRRDEAEQEDSGPQRFPSLFPLLTTK